MAKKLDWDKVWQAFEDWYRAGKPTACKHCGTRKYNEKDEWEVQQKAIQRIVNKELGRG